MKRSGFKRGLTGMLSTASRQLSARKKPAKRHSLKRRVFRSKSYLAAVRTLPCVCCGAVGRTQAAHSNQPRFGKGARIKASDASAMSFCGPLVGVPGCHATHDQGGKRAKEDWWQFEYLHICKTVIGLVRTGRLKGSPDTMATVPFVIHDAEEIAVYLVGLIESGQLEVVN